MKQTIPTETQKEKWRKQSREAFQRLKQRPEAYRRRLDKNAESLRKLGKEEIKRRRAVYAKAAYAKLKTDSERYARRLASNCGWKRRHTFLHKTPLPLEPVVEILIPYLEGENP